MKVAVIGSRSLRIIDIEKYLPENTTEIVSGGVGVVDKSAREYAYENSIFLKDFFPDYERYGRLALLKRNLSIIDYADKVLAFWDGKSQGIKYVINRCEKSSVPLKIIMCK